MRKEEVNIFIHRRDLRIHDNIALNKLIELTEPETKILHIFIFNPEQIDSKKNAYFNKNTVEFMVQCLQDLNMELNDGLHCFYGKDTDILLKLLMNFRVNFIAFNLDHTPYAIKRDNELMSWCKSKGLSFVVGEDYTLFPFDNVKSSNGKVYEVFTPFYRKCLSMIDTVKEPQHVNLHNICTRKNFPGVVKNIDQYYMNEPNRHLALNGGRKLALSILQQIKSGKFSNYAATRDYPALDSTTHLSAYLKYGCISIREAFQAICERHGKTEKNGLLRELIWREFYAHVAYNYPHVLEGQIKNSNKSFKPKYNALAWKYDKRFWDAFIQGKTGVPFVDAGIRQLTVSGWCHNRARMIIANFAAKDLHLPPNDVEKWFASNLIDYDPCSNSGGVQWAYGIGSDAQPYFRIFNPFTQSVKYDPNTEYIRKWIPELRQVPTKTIHEWYLCSKSNSTRKHKCDSSIQYPAPIVDHATQSKKSIAMFSAIH